MDSFSLKPVDFSTNSRRARVVRCVIGGIYRYEVIRADIAEAAREANLLFGVLSNTDSIIPVDCAVEVLGERFIKVFLLMKAHEPVTYWTVGGDYLIDWDKKGWDNA